MKGRREGGRLCDFAVFYFNPRTTTTYDPFRLRIAESKRRAISCCACVSLGPVNRARNSAAEIGLLAYQTGAEGE